jgi:hypothetical protein
MEAARNHRASLKNPPKTSDEYLADLDAQGLGKTAIALKEFASTNTPFII